MLVQLHSDLAAILPRAHPLARAVIEAVLLREGSIGKAEIVAHELGLPNRFHLARLLKRAGLPSLRRFAGLVEIDSWVSSPERTGKSLFELAVRAHRHPSACYRLVRELTGLTWGQVRKLGSRWVEGCIVRGIVKSSRGSNCHSSTAV